MIIDKLIKQQVLRPGGDMPKWLAANTHYLTIMGSEAYGVSSGSSDIDIYGFAIPPKDIVFPHLAGHVPGFGPKPQSFEVWQQHHIKTPDGKKEYDFSVYSIVKYLSLVAENNPNMIDSIFTPERCIIHSTQVGNMFRERRRSLLHKGAWHKFKGYAYGQLHKIATKRQDVPEVQAVLEFEAAHTLDSRHMELRHVTQEVNDRQRRTGYTGRLMALSDEEVETYHSFYSAMVKKSKRYESLKRFGMDTKFAYHVVRLMAEVEQILVEGDLDLERNREELKAIRRGDWTYEDIVDRFQSKEKGLEAAYEKSTLPHGPDWKALNQLLLDALETHYGSISTAVTRDQSVEVMIRDLEGVIDRYRNN